MSAADLGVGSAAPITGSAIAVRLFATPRGTPTDDANGHHAFDDFRQHHLGHYQFLFVRNAKHVDRPTIEFPG